MVICFRSPQTNFKTKLCVFKDTFFIKSYKKSALLVIFIAGKSKEGIKTCPVQTTKNQSIISLSQRNPPGDIPT